MANSRIRPEVGNAEERRTKHQAKMAARAAQLVPLKVPAGFVLAPGLAPVEVAIGPAAARLTWADLADRWGLVKLRGVVVSSPVHCWASLAGPRAFPDSGEMNAWKPSPRMLQEGNSLTLAAHKRGTAELFPFVADPSFIRPTPAPEDAPLPGLLRDYFLHPTP